MPVEASALIGSLGGIASLAREAFGDGGQAPQRPGPRVPTTGSPTAPVDRP
jgi:hypothetical protein